jgi:hypothetical protein
MALGQQFHGFSSPSWEEEGMIENLPSLVQSFDLFGSGYAGLGTFGTNGTMFTKFLDDLRTERNLHTSRA